MNTIPKFRRFRIITWLVIIALGACISFFLAKKVGEKERFTDINNELIQGRELSYQTYKKLKLLASAHISEQQLLRSGLDLGVMETLSYEKFPHAPASYTHALYHSKSLYVFFVRFTEEGLMDCAWGGIYCGPR